MACFQFYYFEVLLHTQLLAFFSEMQGLAIDVFDMARADAEMAGIINEIGQLLE
jgi:hypothetical protein